MQPQLTLMRMLGMMAAPQPAPQAVPQQEKKEDRDPTGQLVPFWGIMAPKLRLSDEQRMQVQTLVRNHAKDVIRFKADIDTMALDVRPLLDADPVDLAKVKQLLQAIAAKEADVRLAHITAMQDIRKLLTPEQQKQFRTMQGHMMGDGGMMGRGGMMGHGSQVQ